MDDNHIPECRWLSTDASPQGDESGTIPRINSYCVVGYIESEPFIIGFWNPTDKTGSANVGEVKEELNEGDKIIKTIGKNKIILRAHGEIQIQSTDTNRTVYFPDQHLINTLCRNYEFRTDGGTIDWHNINEDDETYFKEEFRDNISRSNLVIEERGKVDGTIVSRTTVGAGDNSSPSINQPVYTETTKSTGETELFIRAPGASSGHKYTILPSGTTKLNIADKTTVTIDQSGETTIDIGPGKATLNIKPNGDTTYTTSGKITTTATGNVALTTSGNLNVTSSGPTKIKAATISLNGSSSGITTKNSHMGVIDLITGVPVNPSPTVTSDV
ncbi:MAG: hypothetical protein EBZ49_00200 [Proteobacteria bacterium]|nr:hypothetical protein [Pseudomonadota bacterium]